MGACPAGAGGPVEGLEPLPDTGTQACSLIASHLCLVHSSLSRWPPLLSALAEQGSYFIMVSVPAICADTLLLLGSDAKVPGKVSHWLSFYQSLPAGQSTVARGGATYPHGELSYNRVNCVERRLYQKQNKQTKKNSFNTAIPAVQAACGITEGS